MVKIATRETKVFRESLAALSFDLGGLLAGGLVSSFIRVVAVKPWGIMLYPVVLGVRGAINGVLSGRLTTALHVGTIEPGFKREQTAYYALLTSILTLSLVAGVVMGFAVCLVARLAYGESLFEMPVIVCSAVTANVSSFILTGPITSIVAFTSYKKGADPDVVTYPITSTVADVVATTCYVTTLFAVFTLGVVGVVFTMCFTSLSIILVIASFLRFRGEEEYMRTIREALLAVLLTSGIEQLSGFALSSVRGFVERYPAILTVYPVMIDALGDVGSIYGSLLTTRLVLGLLEPGLSILKEAASELWQVFAAGFILFSGVGVLSSFGGGFRVGSIPLIAYGFSFPAATLISALSATYTFKAGLDPDNFVLPLVTAFSDALLTCSVAFAILLIL